jgi:predicted translin family RNA/ssDNA-binding protein
LLDGVPDINGDLRRHLLAFLKEATHAFQDAESIADMLRESEETFKDLAETGEIED